MPTYEMRCDACGEKRWPTLPERPLTYTCARCVSVDAAQREKRREQGYRSASTRKSRQKSSEDSTEASA
jgi:hypothetical protein